MRGLSNDGHCCRMLGRCLGPTVPMTLSLPVSCQCPGCKAGNEGRGVWWSKPRLSFNPVSEWPQSLLWLSTSTFLSVTVSCPDLSLAKLGHYQCGYRGVRAGLGALSWGKRKSMPEGILHSFQPYLGEEEVPEYRGNSRRGWHAGGIWWEGAALPTFRLVLIHSLLKAKTPELYFSLPTAISPCLLGQWSGREGEPNSRSLFHRNVPIWWPPVNRNVCWMHHTVYHVHTA